MELYGNYDKSIPQKVVINLIEICFLWLSFEILFGGSHWLLARYKVNISPAIYYRRLIILTFNIVTFFRLAYMMFFLLKRKIPWAETAQIPFAFAIYYCGYAWLVLKADVKIDIIDYLAILIFIAGSFINTCAEVLRNQWKKQPLNKGKLYTSGLFKYARHINYFGDILWVSAYALITKNWYAAIIPAFIICFFAFYNAPKLDSYLLEKYGQAFKNYKFKTKMLIPFLW